MDYIKREFSTSDERTRTQVVRTPEGWLVTRWMKAYSSTGSGQAVSVHQVHVSDPLMSMDPAVFAGPGEHEQ